MKKMTNADVWFKALPIDQQEEEIQKIGRTLFSSPDGAIFLSVILDDLGYTRIAESPDQEARKNYASYFLTKRLGLTTDSLAVTTALLNIQNEKEN